MTAQTNGIVISNDWHDRYYHVDQILDKPGPRTEPGFAAGEQVRSDIACPRSIVW